MLITIEHTDFFEVSILIGACFIVNYVTADAKTNWAEGFAMVAFYLMIVRRFFGILGRRLDCISCICRPCVPGFIQDRPRLRRCWRVQGLSQKR